MGSLWCGKEEIPESGLVRGREGERRVGQKIV